MREGIIAPRGDLELRVIRGQDSRKVELAPAPLPKGAFGGLSVREIVLKGFPVKGLTPEVWEWRKKNLPNLYRGMKKVMLARFFKIPTFYGQVDLRVILANGEEIDLGLASLRVVTTVAVNAIVDAFDAAVGFTLNTFNYHAIGTGAVAEAVGDTALGTELTTEYTGNVRATGTQTQPSANIYRTTGTNTLDSGTPAVTEHGVLTQAATGGGSLLDRSVFAAVNLVGASGDGLQSQYSLTLTAGS